MLASPRWADFLCGKGSFQRKVYAMKLNDLFEYNSCTGDLKWKISPSANVKAGDVAGCKNGRGYVRVSLKGKLYVAHRIIWELINGEIPEGMEIDHINSVPDDNRIENLRLVTHVENCRNQKQQCNNNSGITGVSWHKASGKWLAFIHKKEKKIYLGCFDCIEDAAAERRRAEKRLGFHDMHGRK